MTSSDYHTEKSPAVNEPYGISAQDVAGAESVAQVRAYPQAIDAIVLSGTHTNPRRLIGGKNKAFLPMAGRPLVRHVVDALLEAETIAEIFVVGPVEKLGLALQGVPARVRMVQQEGKVLKNTWAGVYASESRHMQEDKAATHNRPLLVISCDLPLVSGAAIDDFVARCAAEDRATDKPFAMMVGVVDEPGVSSFHPREGEEGIERPFVESGFGRLRLANIYVARPRQLKYQDFLQTGFSYRKAKDWRNVAHLVLSLFRQHGGWAAAWLTVRLQLTQWALRLAPGLYGRLRKGNTRERLEHCTGTVLGGSIRIVTSPFGGLSLDVDEEEDYRILGERYADWIAIHDATDTARIPLPKTPP
jgi:GTP:adenosylcobinamide-phosphate guanylyltransferase